MFCKDPRASRGAVSLLVGHHLGRRVLVRGSQFIAPKSCPSTRYLVRLGTPEIYWREHG
jgi:hypothetical protein